MTHARPVAVRPRHEYHCHVRAVLQLLVLLSVALLPLTSFAAREGTPADLTSSAAVELEQGALPTPGQRTAPAPHRHCTHWAAEAGTCPGPASNVSARLLPNPSESGQLGFKMAGPQAPTPPPKA